MRRRIAALAILAVPVLACSAITGPDCDETVVEVSYGELYQIDMSLLRLTELDGFDCRADGKVRDAFGRIVGQRYACERCD